jgi:CheY-like chemotaxis protein
MQMPKVLLVEDDVTMVSLLKTLLKMEGFEVLEVQDDTDILATLRKERPDAVLMDVHLAHRDGVEILDSIRGNPATRNISVLMTSGMNLREECMRHGATDFLLKPFMPDELTKMLKKVVRRN